MQYSLRFAEFAISVTLRPIVPGSGMEGHGRTLDEGTDDHSKLAAIDRNHASASPELLGYEAEPAGTSCL
jgi:hypothetical protein